MHSAFGGAGGTEDEAHHFVPGFDGELLEEVRFHAASALEAPVVVGDLLNEDLFGRVGGLVFFEEALAESDEFLGFFTECDDFFGEEAVFEGIAGRSGFAFWGAWASGIGCIGLVGVALGFRNEVAFAIGDGGCGSGWRGLVVHKMRFLRVERGRRVFGEGVRVRVN